MKIYIAGPFFTEDERVHLDNFIKLVKSEYPNADLFIPNEHFINNGTELPNEIWGKKVFDMDCAAIDTCDFIFAMYLGHVSDTGTAWEIGYAYAKGIPILLYTPNEVNSISCMVANSTILASRNIHCLDQK